LHSASVAFCRTPPACEQCARLDLMVTIELTTNLQDFSADGNVFEYQHALLRLMTPRSGPSTGGTLLTVVGTNILPTNAALCADLACTFVFATRPSVSVSASKQDASSVLCRAPKVSTATYSSIFIRVHNASIGGGSFFSFLDLAQISSIWPGAGPSAGGTRIQVWCIEKQIVASNTC
jgi:hypothetical protein